MGIEVQWDNPNKTIILMTLSGRWEWSELEEAVLLCNQMIESVPHHVHFILDRQGGHWTPGNLLNNIGKIVSMFTPNDGYRIIVMDNPLVKDLLKMYSSIGGNRRFRYRHANSIEEARAFLEQQPVRLRNYKAQH